MKRIAVLASGGGTNLQAMLDHFESRGDERAGDVVLVTSDRPAAGALTRARARGIATAIVEERRGEADKVMGRLLREHHIDVIALAGYLRLVPVAIVEQYRGRILNVHPALLPAFGGAGMYGARVHQAVLDSGALVSGASVHFVDQSYDRGPLIAQWPVPVFPEDTPSALAARVLRIEHVLYPLVVDAVAGGRISLGDDGRIQRTAPRPPNAAIGEDWAFILSPSPGPRLASEIARTIGA